MQLTRDNYFSHQAGIDYMSVSQFKSFSKCQNTALAEIKGLYKREKTTALIVGSYVDAYFDGDLDDFIKKNPEIFKRDGTLKSDFLQANTIIQRIERDKLFMDYISGKKQIIMTGVISGIPVKIMMDSYHPGDKIVDRKIMKDFSDGYDLEAGHVPWYEHWGYDLQGAVYQEIVRQNTGEKLPFYLAAATKEKEPDIDILHIDQQELDFALDRFMRDAPLYDAIKQGIIEPERCEKCEYCRKTKVLEVPSESSSYFI